MLSLLQKVGYEEGELLRRKRLAADPFGLMIAASGADIDFVAGTAIGGTQPYGNNTNDGRLLRDPTNTVACFLPNAAGVYQSLGAAGIRRTTKGAYNYPSATVRNLWGGDLTNAAWVVSTAGADITKAKDQIGIDGSANAASSLTCVNANGTVLQALVLGAANYIYQVSIKRLVGVGAILMTIDGVTFVDVTAQIGASYATAFITQNAVTNPSLGFKMATPGDKIAVDCNMLFTPPVITGWTAAPREDLVRTGAATILNSQSRPSADIADAAPNTLINIARGPFAFYHECTSTRPIGGFLITGATGIFVSVDATGAVKFNANAGQSITAAGKWKSDGVGINRTAGWFSADGRIKMACNGALGSLDTDATVEAALDHFDLSTNGAGSNSLLSWTRRLAMAPNVEFTDTQLLQMAF
jgi:hypothetical protein